jgi:hypothetical protein
MMKLMTTFALTMLTACAVEGSNVSTTNQELSGWMCTQQCADGTTSSGSGSTPDEAYQNLPGCGPGGGPIMCDEKELILQ